MDYSAQVSSTQAWAEIENNRTYSKRAGEDLSRLIEQKLDVKIDPIALRLFIRAYWARVSAFAHAIHNEKE